MYKLHISCNLNFLNIRGIYFSKKLTKKHKKNTLVYLRSPKHFNIGKHKVFSFNNINTLLINLKLKIPLLFVLKNTLFFYKILQQIYRYKLLFRFNSIRINTTTKIKF